MIEYREGYYYRDKYNDLWLAVGNQQLMRVKDENYGNWYGGSGLELEACGETKTKC